MTTRYKSYIYSSGLTYTDTGMTCVIWGTPGGRILGRAWGKTKLKATNLVKKQINAYVERHGRIIYTKV